MADEEPGTVLRISPEDLLPPPGQSLSLHDVGLLEALAAARQLGESPHEVIVFGVQPQVVECGLDLSPELARFVPRIIELVLAELECAGGPQRLAS
jgi:hydrogenase maturation protease